MVEGGGAFGERVDRRGDGRSRIEHRVEIRDGVVGVEEVGCEGIEDQFASSSGDEPIVGEGDGWCIGFLGCWGHIGGKRWNN